MVEFSIILEKAFEAFFLVFSGYFEFCLAGGITFGIILILLDLILPN